MNNLYCSSCGQPCVAVLSEVGLSAECCFEARLMTEDTDSESRFCPCEAHRKPTLRFLTRHEEEELRRDLYAELEKSETPQQRAYRRSMDRS